MTFGKKYKAAHRASHRIRYRKSSTKHYRKRYDLIAQLKSKPCTDCKKRYPPWVMQFDHRNPAEKLFNLGSNVTSSWDRVIQEVAKCDVVCANCHANRTYQRKRT